MNGYEDRWKVGPDLTQLFAAVLVLAKESPLQQRSHSPPWRLLFQLQSLEIGLPELEREADERAVSV